MGLKIIKITKDKTVVTCEVEDRNKPITYDMSTFTFTSYTGRKVIKFPNSANEIGTLSRIETLLLDAMKMATNNSCFHLTRLEKFIAYPELIENSSSLPDKCPKGYIKWLQENNKTATWYSLNEFLFINKINKRKEDERELLKTLTLTDNAPYSISDNFIDWLIDDKQKIFFTKLIKIFKISVKNRLWTLFRDLKNFVDLTFTSYGYDSGKKPENWLEIIDTNRDFDYNSKLLRETAEELRNKKILENEKKIISIENLSNEQFTIIVPKTMRDFTNEGQRQHNCVGYYYHDSIANGFNLIYFIRITKNPNESYLTNRYNLVCEKTVETRGYCNHTVNDRKAYELIDKIDEKIKELLK